MNVQSAQTHISRLPYSQGINRSGFRQTRNDKKAHLHRPCLSGEMFLGTKMHLHSNNVQLKFHSLTHSLTGIISLTVFCNGMGWVGKSVRLTMPSCLCKYCRSAASIHLRMRQAHGPGLVGRRGYMPVEGIHSYTHTHTHTYTHTKEISN